MNRIFTGKASGQAFAIWGSTIGGATALGPVIEGRTVGWVISEQAFALPGFTWDSGLSPAFIALALSVIPLWLVFAMDYTALQAGAALVPIAIGSFVASGISFPLMAKISPLGLVRIGLVLEVIGLAGIGIVAVFTEAGWFQISLVLFFYGIGVGFATSASYERRTCGCT